MNVAEIKNDLHRLVVETDDLNILNAIKEVFTTMKEKPTGDWWDLLSEQEKQLVKRGLEQADKGEFIPRTQVRANIAQWIKAKS
jgi:hypothetical protein